MDERARSRQRRGGPSVGADTFDVVIVGGGPAGLAGALTLARSRKRVLLCDAGPRRNATAARIHNFVTRDGTPPDEFRRIGREQLAAYPNVETRESGVVSITGARGAFHISLTSGTAVKARRVLLCTGMIDELPAIEGFRALWGHSIFQCPYCHGWEVQDRRWGYLVNAADAQRLLPFALQARGWTRDLVVFAGGNLEIPEETRVRLQSAGVRIETAPLARLIARDRRLEAVQLSTGMAVPCDVLFTHPSQRQVEVVRALGVALEDNGHVRTHATTNETSVPGVYAAGDLTSGMQSAIWAAAASARAAAMINVELTMELASRGAL